MNIFNFLTKKNDDEIEELYNSLIQSAKISRNKSVIKKWLIKQRANSSRYTLSEDDERTILKWI